MGNKKSFRLDLFYFIKEGVLAIISHGFMSFAAVVMIVACLLIMGSFSLVALNLDQMLGDLESENEFLAYVDEDYSSQEAEALQTALGGLSNISSLVFVSREEAMEAYRSAQDYNELLDSLPAEVLRDRYRIRVHEIEEMEDTVNKVLATEGVADVSVALEIANGFVVLRNIANVIATILTVILCCISLFIMSNTIKLATFYRREEIAIMKMCGATNGFVRAPFVVEGMILGCTGALFGFFFQWMSYQVVYQLVTETAGMSLLTMMPFSEIALVMLQIFLGSGFVIGVGGSLLAIRKFLQV